MSHPRALYPRCLHSASPSSAQASKPADRNTTVAVRVYLPAAIQRAIAAGAQCIEHGPLMDEKTATLMADMDIWLSTQSFVDDSDTIPLTGQSRLNQSQAIAGTNTVFTLWPKSIRSRPRLEVTCCFLTR